MPTGDRPTIIIPVHRARRDVHECLVSLRSSGDLAAAEVIVVDDFSDDGTAEMVERDFPDVTLVRRTTNGGFARAWNTGMTRVPVASRFVALLNSDTTVQDGWLQAAIEAMARDESVGAVAPRIVLHADPATIDSAGQGYTIAGWAYRRGHGSRFGPPFDKAAAVFGTTGCAAVFRRRALDVGAGGLVAHRVETRRHDLDALGMQLLAQGLPPGQVIGAASVGGPGDQDDLLAAERREIERTTLEIGEHEVRRRRGGEGKAAEGRRSQRRQCVGVSDDRHPQPIRNARYVHSVVADGVAGQGYADVSPARTLGRERPSGAELERSTIHAVGRQQHVVPPSSGYHCRISPSGLGPVTLVRKTAARGRRTPRSSRRSRPAARSDWPLHEGARR